MTFRKPLTKAELSAIAACATVAVTVLPTGARTLTEREIYDAQRDPPARSIDPVDQRHIVIDHCDRMHVRNGYGEWL